MHQAVKNLLLTLKSHGATIKIVDRSWVYVYYIGVAVNGQKRTDQEKKDGGGVSLLTALHGYVLVMASCVSFHSNLLHLFHYSLTTFQAYTLMNLSHVSGDAAYDYEAIMAALLDMHVSTGTGLMLARVGGSVTASSICWTLSTSVSSTR